MDPIHEAQIITYRKLSDIQIGLIFNFTINKLKDGMKRYVLRSPLRVLRALRGEKELEPNGVGNPESIPARSEIHRGLDLLGRAA